MQTNIFYKLDTLNICGDRSYALEYNDKLYILRLEGKAILNTYNYYEVLDFIQELLDGYFAHPHGWLGEVEEDILAIA
jgi:hypothetical protein